MGEAIHIYEHVPEEIDEALPFRNAIFGHITLDQWKAMGCTAVVAREAEKIVGFIPLQFREQCLRPGVSIPVVYENAVGVAEGKRGRGLGSRMLDVAAEFVSDLADAMMVIRGGERSAGYRFYRRSGHGDVAYARDYVLSSAVLLPSIDASDISVFDRDQWRAIESQLLELYDQRYGRFGGGRVRKPGYWDHILDSHVYRDQLWSLAVMQSTTGCLAGYMVAARGLWALTQDTYVYEVVGKNDEAVVALINYARKLSPSGGIIFHYMSLANPMCTVLRRLGFEEQDTTPHIMARILRPDRIFERLARGSRLCGRLSLTINTPHRSLIVNEPSDPRYRVVIETKENLLSRLLLCRLHLEAAIEMELVRWNVHDVGLARELHTVFGFAPWVQWFTDYV